LEFPDRLHPHFEEVVVNAIRSVFILAALIVCSLSMLAQGPRGGSDPVNAVYWSAAQMKETDARLASRVNPQTHNAGAQLIASANAIYRTGLSQSEIHEKQADFIVVRDGEGVILVGGKMVGGKPERANELRGDSIEGGTRYSVAAGDSLYIPAGMPHQFFVDAGEHLAITIVKLTQP
jgi:mannose-6-phosphate isomerase-like protein (cupin superfamily)